MCFDSMVHRKNSNGTRGRKNVVTCNSPYIISDSWTQLTLLTKGCAKLYQLVLDLRTVVNVFITTISGVISYSFLGVNFSFLIISLI